MAQVTIDRELLERIDESAICDGTDATISDDLFTQLVAALAAPRQPEGDGLEVVAWQDADNPLYTTAEKRVLHDWANNGYPIVELCRLSDAQAIIDGLRGERDQLRAEVERLSGELERLGAQYVTALHHVTQLRAALTAPVQGDGWIPIIERLPQIKQVLSEKCTIEGREIPTLYRSGMVLTFDGSRVSAGIVEWFHSKSPLNNVTHWMPLPAAPEVV